MGKGKAKFNKLVNKKAKKSKSETSSRQRWSGGNEPIQTNHLRNKDGYSLRGTPIEEPLRKKSLLKKSKRKDNSYELRSGKINCSSTVKPITKKKKKGSEAEEVHLKAAAAAIERTATLDRSSPWLEAQMANDNENTEQRPLKRPRSAAGLPTVNLPTEILDPELLAFATYVQLTPEEQAARQALVQFLQKVAAKQQQEVRVFGSFATPQVCVFMSDIDIALWGAIPDPPAPVAAVKAAPTPAQLEQERKRKRTESWKQALAQLDAANETVPDAVRHASVGSLAEALSTEKSFEEEASPSFVIDRVGSVAELSKPIVENTTIAQSSTAAIAHKIASSRDSHDESDDDSADKMESYQRSSSSKIPQSSNARYVSLSSESSDDESVLEEDSQKVNDMQVSFFNDPPLVRAGPTGRIRNKVLNALGSFRHDIRSMHSKWIRKVTFITKARVPILKMDTALGVEVDVAVGGHNGADTSQFAAKQSELYRRYAHLRFACI